MHPVIARLGPLCIYSYGLMVALGFALAISLAYANASRFGIDKDRIVDFGIAVLIGGLVGARIFYILINLKYYAANPAEMIDLTKGGLVWYGGFLSGIAVGLIFVKKFSINFWDGADLLAPFIALAQAVGRIGCFLNGCCYGVPAAPSNMLGVIFPGENFARHPAQIYESITLLVIFLILKKWQSSRHFKGEIFLGYVILCSAARFAIEFIRGDNLKIFALFTIAQIISAAIFLICLVILALRFVAWKKSLSRSA